MHLCLKYMTWWRVQNVYKAWQKRHPFKMFLQELRKSKQTRQLDFKCSEGPLSACFLQDFPRHMGQQCSTNRYPILWGCNSCTCCLSLQVRWDQASRTFRQCWPFQMVKNNSGSYVQRSSCPYCSKSHWRQCTKLSMWINLWRTHWKKAYVWGF